MTLCFLGVFFPDNVVVYDHPSGEFVGLLLQPDDSPEYILPENTALFLPYPPGFYVRIIAANFPTDLPNFKFAYATTLVEAKRELV